MVRRLLRKCHVFNLKLIILQLVDGITKDLMSDEIKIGEYKDVPLMLNGRDVGKDIVKNLNPKRVQKIELLRFPKGRYGDMPIVLNIVTYDNFSGYDLGMQSNGMISLHLPHPHSENVDGNRAAACWNTVPGPGPCCAKAAVPEKNPRLRYGCPSVPARADDRRPS